MCALPKMYQTEKLLHINPSLNGTMLLSSAVIAVLILENIAQIMLGTHEIILRIKSKKKCNENFQGEASKLSLLMGTSLNPRTLIS